MSVRVAAIKKVNGVENEMFDYEGSIWRVTKIDGLGSPNIEVFEANRGFGNGSFITGKRQTSRQIDIEAVCQKTGESQNTWRAQAQKYHSENWSSSVYDLFFQIYGGTYGVKNCVLQGFKISTDNAFRRPTMTVSFLCPDSLLTLYGATSFETKYPTNSQPDTYAAFSGFTKNPNILNRYADRITISLPEGFNNYMDSLFLRKGNNSRVRILHQEGSILEGNISVTIRRDSDGTGYVMTHDAIIIRHLDREDTDSLFYLPTDASYISYTAYTETEREYDIGKFSSTSTLRILYDCERYEVMGV